uniref:SCP domain-containing protein n=1 Tax=Heliothis virescens TaxID=7102 RepID=A0A2A4JYH5_HELVI
MNPVGQHCHSYVRFTITPQMVYQILEEVNYIRLKVASGKEIGKDDLPLPRAYGMMKMFWDSELATLAQVLADQCLGLKEDQCRATEKFPNPSQVITLINFKVPHWDYLTRNTTTRGLTKEKITFAIEKALKSLHAVKKLVDPSVIYDCPPMEELPDMSSRSYLKLIRGKATHIGCGMSAYTRYQILHNGAENVYNSVQIVCNISDGPKQSQSLYTTDPPIPGTGFTEHCGCPPGYQETEGCLCEPMSKKTEDRIDRVQWEPHDENENEIGLHPAVTPCTDPVGNGDHISETLALPIFHVEDYPTGNYEPTNEIEAQFHQRFGNMTFLPSESSLEKNEISDETYEKKPKYIKIRQNNTSHIQRRNMTPKRKKKYFKLKHKAVPTTTEKPVVRTERYEESISLDEFVFDHNPQVTKIHDDFEKNKIDDDVNKENDTSFLTLLDSLERKVQDVELEGTEREIFDAKMRKIYEAVLKTKMAPTTTTIRTTKTTKVKKTTTHRSNVEQVTFRPDDNESDLHDKSENLKTTSEVPFEDLKKSFERRIFEDTEPDYQQNTINDNYLGDESQHWEQKDKESDEFSKIITEKTNHAFKADDNRDSFDYFRNKHNGLNHYNIDRLYDKPDKHNLIQEDIDNYYENKGKSEQSFNDYKSRVHNIHSYVSRKTGSEEHTKTLEAGIKKPAFEIRQAMKNAKREFSPPINVNVWKAPAFGYRPIYDIITLILVIIKATKCSMVLDAASQNTVYVTEYCPKQKYCKEGTHVMCMYYDPNQEFGPRCGDPIHIKITTTMVDKILEYVNEVRRRIASGTEKGMGNELLPKAFGMMKMQWDRELATLAQVLANQCLGGREDLCRSTERFPNPSQSIAIIHFTYPDWEYLKNNNGTEKGLNEEKLTFALQRFIKSAHALKRTVNKDIIMDFPPINELPDTNAKYYLNLIRGSATHIGCGLSAYSNYKIGDGEESIQNSVQVVCNVSDGPQIGEPLYNTNAPFPGGSYSKRCGCPKGYKETRGCLCEEDSVYMWKSTVTASLPGYLNMNPKFKYKKLKDPIIKLESFRPLLERGRLQVKSGSQEEDKIDSSKSTETITHSDEQPDDVKLIKPILTIKHTPSESNMDDDDMEGEKQQAYFRGRNTSFDDNYSRKVPLQSRKTENQYKEMKRVTPPKRKYAPTYVKNLPIRPDTSKPQMRLREKPVNIVDEVLNVDEESATEGLLDVAEEFIIDNDRLSNVKRFPDKKSNKERNPNKLLHILNILEQEVKNTQFDTNLHKEFNTKMQRIYEIAAPQESAKPQREVITQFDDTDKKSQDNKYATDSYKNIEDEIITLRRQPNRSQIDVIKRSRNDDEFIKDPSYDYVETNPGKAIDLPRYGTSTDNPYENVLTKKNHYHSNRNNQSMDNRNSHFKYNDILDGKVTLDREYRHNDVPTRRFLTKAHRTIDNDMIVRKTILSKALEDTDNADNYNFNYEEKNVVVANPIENRINKKLQYANKMKVNKSSARKMFLVPERRAQFNPTFQQTNKNGELRQMKLLRPKFEDMSSKYPFQRQLPYLSDREQEQQ